MLRYAFVAWMALVPLQVWANDGAAGLEGGDLRFKNLKGVQMAEEILSISPTLVRVRYRFENKTSKPIKTLVSFPIKADLGADTVWDTRSPNPSQFTLQVNGKAQAFKTKSTTKDDVLTLQHYWEQTFLPNQVTEIEHTYVPIFEDGVMYALPDVDFGSIAQEHYCASAKEAEWIAKKHFKLKPLTYILSTARTWEGPIRSFKLRIEKGDRAAIFLCTELKLKKTADGAFEAEAADYVPKKELVIGYVGAF